MRVPLNRVAEVESLLAGVSLLDELMALSVRWGEKLRAHRDSEGRVTAPRWEKCSQMWQELDLVMSGAAENRV
jgi:hypothetical protein